MTLVAALQFSSNCDVDENLSTCLRMIDQAAEMRPRLMVLPEFCNHLSWYDDQDHAWRVALERDGAFLTAIAERAQRHRCFIVINVSLRRADKNITVTSLLFDPNKQCIAEADKQTLMGHENDFFTRADCRSDVIETSVGRLGIFPCRDGVTCETPRGLALRGAQIFCDSLNSFALDEASLHVPARAPENKVFLIAANKVGPLIPEDQLEMASQFTHIPVPFLMGAGESQILAPDGSVLAKAPRGREAVIVADIDVSLADDKTRPDGSDSFANRRPSLYQSLSLAPSAAQLQQNAEGEPQGYADAHAAPQMDVALIRPDTGQWGEDALSSVAEKLASLDDSVELVVLPELFWLADSDVSNPAAALIESQSMESSLRKLCATHKLMMCFSVVESIEGQFQHLGLLINAEGRLLAQAQLHRAQRHSWMTVGEGIATIDLPMGRVGILTGDDSAYPELAKVFALQGVHVLLVPFDCQETWECQLGLRSRAAENRVCVVASSRPTAAGSGLIASLQTEFTIMKPWHTRTFDGHINSPIVTVQDQSVTLAQIHPQAAANKVMSANTDLLMQRPWHLCEDIISEREF
jgi:predicted amidohydrolase